MKKKIFIFMKQSNDSFKKDVYYRLLANSSYNWSLSSLKILLLLHKVQNSKAIKVFIIDDTVEDKVGKNVEGSCDSLYSNKEKRKVRGIYADYLPVDSWYSKPVFIKEMNTLGLRVISRMANNNKIWNFIGKEKTLETIYNKFKEIKSAKPGNYGKKIKFTYFCAIVEHKTAGRLKIVFIKTKEKLIPLVSTDLNISDEEIIETYKRRWDIEQGYKELREHFGFGKEENRIYEALIARITLSFFTYNIVSYINRT